MKDYIEKLLWVILILLMVSPIYAGPIGNIHKADIDGNGYLNVNVQAGGFVGSTTPTDAFTNPTDAVKSFSLGASYNGTGWDMLRTAYADDLTTGVLATGLMGWNVTGAGFNRLLIDDNGSLHVNPAASNHANDNIAILPDNAVLTANTTTATSTAVNAAAGDLLKVIVGVGVASSTFKIYNDASAPCGDGLIGTYDSATSGVVYNFGIPLSTGICILTSGATDLTVVYRDNP